MTPEELRLFYAVPSIELRVNSAIAPPGEPKRVNADGKTTFYFHTRAEMDAWLDAAKERGMQG